MERLTNHFDYCKVNECKYCDEELLKQNKCQFFDVDISHCYEKRVHDKLREYEDAEEQGLLIRLPVPIGGSVYILDYIFECKLDYKCDDPCEFKCNDDVFCEHEYKKYRIREAKFKYEMLEYIGKTAFLTRGEAEAALSEMEG